MLRAYGPINTRQQGADRLVMNEDDLRRVLWQAVDPNYTGVRPSTIRLGTNIRLSRPIELKAAQYNVTIDGGLRFAIEEAPGFQPKNSGFFVLETGQTSDLVFSNLLFSILTVDNIFVCDTSTTVNDINIINCSLDGYVGSVSMFSQPITATDVKVLLDEAAAFSVGPSGTIFTGTLQLASYLEFNYFNTRPILSRNNVGVGCGTTGPLLSLDVNGGLRLRPFTVTLGGADPTIDVGDKTTFQIFFDGTESGTLQLTSSYTGHVIVLYFAQASSNMVVDNVLSPAAGKAIIDVNKNNNSKHPTIHETITFMYINGRWVELCRSENN